MSTYVSRPAAGPLAGELRAPGDKSLSHRALMIAALAEGHSELSGLNGGADVEATGRMLSQLGATCEVTDHKALVKGCGREGLNESDDVLDAGNSGTTMRLGLGLCAGLQGASVLTGDASLRRRPMLRVVEPLRSMGARIDGRDRGERAPLFVRGGPLQGGALTTSVASAQVKSSLLLAGLKAAGTTSVTEPSLSRDHTERMLGAAGVRVSRSGLTVSVEGGDVPLPVEWNMPGDVSSAVYLVAAASMVPSSRLSLKGVGLNPTRVGALQALREMGAHIETEPTGEEAGEPVGTIRIRASRLQGMTIEPSSVPGLIDEIPILAVAATQATGETVITGAAELRVKESDRIDSVVAGITALGGNAHALADGLIVTGPTRLAGGIVESFGDHRVALSFAVAGLVASDEVTIEGWECVATSFPEFSASLAQVGAAATGKRYDGDGS
ncbi:MAG: 3-phosphoshikimate 1-carboxyvinyltransferase [Actinobacteria bacterium]|nr:3-phosphoshikimate 1-carboxyvinyltransferase [Actinomycetota bacterium]